MSKGLAIVSGGMDSVTMLYEFRDNISHVLNFTYGSKHNEQETAYAELHAKKLGKDFKRIDLGFIGETFKSDLLISGGEVPEGHYEDESMKRTVVPFRNGIMLSIAVGYAESHECTDLWIANHFGDHAIYPDCRKEFIEHFHKSVIAGTYSKIEIKSPYCSKTKREIGLIGKLINVPYDETYSCYKGKPIHCGKCGTCTERIEALEGFDITSYE